MVWVSAAKGSQHVAGTGSMQLTCTKWAVPAVNSAALCICLVFCLWLHP